MAAVLKTVVLKGTGGSNPSASAKKQRILRCFFRFGGEEGGSSSFSPVFEDEPAESSISSSKSSLFEDELVVSPVSSSISAYFEDEGFAARGKRASTARG